MNDITLSLQISGVGMGLVFGAILLLWLMMSVLTSVTADKNAESPRRTLSDSAGSAAVMDGDAKARAAAIAVALALAEQQVSGARGLTTPPTALVSAWQLGMRTKQLYQKGEPINRQQRKLG